MHGFMSSDRHTLAAEGWLQEQYSVYASNEPFLVGTRHAPFQYGLKPTRYRVRHREHSTHLRISTRITVHTIARFQNVPWTLADATHAPRLALARLTLQSCDRDRHKAG